MPNILIPLNDRVLVKKIVENLSTIIITESTTESTTGIVVATATPNLYVKSGDKVLFSKYSGHSITYEGTDHVLLKEEELLAVYSTIED